MNVGGDETFFEILHRKVFRETKFSYICSALNEKQNAQMVKSVDTLVSGTSARKGVQVRVLFWAPKEVKNGFLFCLLSVSYTLHNSTFTHLEKHVGNISGLYINLSLQT